MVNLCFSPLTSSFSQSLFHHSVSLYHAFSNIGHTICRSSSNVDTHTSSYLYIQHILYMHIKYASYFRHYPVISILWLSFDRICFWCFSVFTKLFLSISCKIHVYYSRYAHFSVEHIVYRVFVLAFFFRSCK